MRPEGQCAHLDVLHGANTTTLSPGTRLGPFEVIELLGAGGMGEVYRAHDPRLGRDVALKVLHPDVAGSPERLHRFEQEARAVAALNHPHILTVHDVGWHEGTPYVVSELLEGESLREVLARRSPTQRQVLGWAVQIARGLAAAHQKSIVHRDLKPENLFLTTDGRIKILDFGLAKLARMEVDSEEMTASHPTKPGDLMGTLAYMSPEQARACPVDARSDIFSFGVVLYEMLTGKHPFRRETAAATLSALLQDTPIELASLDRAIPPAVDGIVRRCLEKQREERFQGAHDLALALEVVVAAPTSAASLRQVEERSPYPGLSSFTERDAAHFFGREDEVKALWKKIHSRKLLGVIGPSGVGKTSFLRAGVLPARPEGWAVLVCTPGTAPFRDLGQALGPALAGDAEALGQLAGFEDPDTAFALLSRWRKSHGDALVVVDQFEELFTLNTPETQARFAGLLGRLAVESDSHVLVSLRDDFLMRCHEHAPLASVFSELTPVGALTPGSLRRALVEPAKRQGYRFDDDGLVDEMVSLVQDVRGALPLLAFAVARLWERRDCEQKLLTRESYQEIGGVEGALAQHAEATMDRIGPERQGLVREIFRNLVTSHGTRAVVDREELLSAFPERIAAEDALGQLIDARLLTSYEVEGKEGEPSHHRVEVVHESLLKAWPRLVRWQAQDQEGTLLRDQLKQAAHLWDEKGRTPDLLWTGTACQEYEVWRARYAGALTALEEDFARSMAEKARRKRRVVRLAVATAFVAITAVAVAIGISRHQATQARDEAKAEALRAEASKLLAVAQLRLKEDPTEALALATASLDLADTDEARLFAVRALAEAPPALETKSEIGDIKIPAFSPDGHWLAVAGHSPEVGVWRDDGSPPVRLPDHDTSPRGGNQAEWASAELLVTGSYGSTGSRVHVWSLPEGRRLRTIDFGAASFWQVGPGRLFAETPETREGTSAGPFVGGSVLRSWRLPDGASEVLGRVDGRKLGITSSCFEPYGRGWLYTRGHTTYLRPFLPEPPGDRVFSRHDGDVGLGVLAPDRLFERDAGGEIRVWSFSEHDAPSSRTIPKPGTAPPRIFPAPSGRRVRSSATTDARVRLWDSSAALPGARPLELRRRGSWYNAMTDFHPAEGWLIATTANLSRLTFWPLADRWPTVVDGYAGIIRPLAFSRDGKWLVTSWPGGQLRLWPLPETGSIEVKELGAQLGVWEALEFDPQDRYLFAVGISDEAWIVPLDGSPRRKLQRFSEDTLLVSTAVSPSGRFVATAFNYGRGSKTLRVWNVATGEMRLFELTEPVARSSASGGPPETTGYEAGVRGLGFVDDSILYTAGHGGVQRWNVLTGSHETVMPVAPTQTAMMWMTENRAQALVHRGHITGTVCTPLELVDLATGASRTLAEYGECVSWAASGPAGVLVSGSLDGTIRVGRQTGAPHILAGHAGPVDRLAISPDLRWIASTGEDNTLRLWPMPDLDQAPLHTLPHDALLAKLRSLTNLRAVRDAKSSTGWTIDVGPFPGWKDVPTW